MNKRTKTGGRTKTLPEGWILRGYKATPDEHEKLRAYLEGLRNPSSLSGLVKIPSIGDVEV